MGNIAVYDVTIKPMTKMLKNLSGYLEKAAQHAATKKTDIATYFDARLIADQLPLLKQIQFSCDNAKFTGSRLTGKDGPVFPDTEKTYDEIQKRIKDTVAYLETIKAEDLSDYKSIKAQFPWNPGQYMDGFEYVTEFAIPNFYFHVATAYSILRKNGIELGKGDYLGQLPFKAL